MLAIWGNEMINNVKILLSHQMIAEIAKFLNPTCNIPYALVKGEALSIQAYNKPGLRQLGDIDILISRRNVKELEHLLIENGFLCLSSGRENRIFSITESHQLSPYYKKIPLQKMFVDINFDIYWGEYTGKRIDIDLFLSDIIDMNIYGYCLKVLPPLKGFIYLLLHHYKDMNSIFHLVRHNTIRRDMFKDVFFYLKNNLNFITLDNFIAICKEMKIEPYAYYILYYTYCIYNEPWLFKFIESVKCSQGLDLLDSYGLCDQERKTWKINFWERLDNKNLYELIKNDLTCEDISKIEKNKKIFG